MFGLTVAWVAVALTAAIQVVGVGIFIGYTRATLNGFGKELKEHKDLDAVRGHGCPWARASEGHKGDTSAL